MEESPPLGPRDRAALTCLTTMKESRPFPPGVIGSGERKIEKKNL